MATQFVLTLTGPDRIGIVDDLTGLLLARGGNVETSRMARLGGEFAVLMLVSMPTGSFAGLGPALEDLVAQGYKLTTTLSGAAADALRPGWRAYQIRVNGADHEGIIHEVAHFLSGRGISIEAMDSETTLAPVSASPLFAMTAQVVVPRELAGQGWEAGLEEIGNRLNLEIEVSAADAS
jgi:glycine cleavage system transcriptional repressor